MQGITIAKSKDVEWGSISDPETRAWFQSLMMPDHPSISCCGEADGYYCDDVKVTNGQATCTITDTRDDAPLRRTHLPVGTIVPIPPNKLGNYPGNPTGHSIVFLGINWNISGSPGAFNVYCFVQGSGI